VKPTITAILDIDAILRNYHTRFHHVSSVERNLAVNIWWSASAKPKLSDCHLPNTTLDKFTFIGFGTLFPREIIDGMKWVKMTCSLLSVKQPWFVFELPEKNTKNIVVQVVQTNHDSLL
jgi:hypothetical protein